MEDTELAVNGADETTVGLTDGQEKPEDRDVWDSKVQFLFSVISFAIGLGNIWRFPYLCQQNGGGAFLIPYFIMLVLEGIPLMYLELALGQRFRKGCVGVWQEMNPLLEGIGWASVSVSFIVGLYYNTIIAWCLYYLLFSLRAVLPWAECPTEPVPHTNLTAPVTECELSDPTSYFWYRDTLDISSGIDVPGGLNWKILIALFCAWLLVYICMCKGIQSSGKVMYITATFPYLVLIIFFVRGITLNGAIDGLKVMFIPKPMKLLDPQTWLEAAAQVFYSLSLAFGGLIAFASYNNPKNNCRRDAIIVSVVSCATSIWACVVIFAVLGFKAHLLLENCKDHNIAAIGKLDPQYLNITKEIYDDLMENSNITQVLNVTGTLKLQECSLEKELSRAAEGTGLAFVIFTQAINEFPGGPFWSVLFFLMLLLLGMGSQFGTVEGVCTAFVDLGYWPWMKRKEIVSGLVSIFGFLGGLLFVSRSGQYWVKVFDTFAGSFSLMFIAFSEMVAVMWIYGYDNFAKDIEFITGAPPGLFWKISWKFSGPILMGLIIIGSVVSKAIFPVSYKHYDIATASLVEGPYPVWVGVVIALLVCVPVLLMPLLAILKKVGVMHYDPVSQAVSETGGTTQSTMGIISFRHIKRGDDQDSGMNSDDEIC